MIDSGGDPNQHILDTLEQCISVIIEKRQPPNAGGSSKTADSGALPADNAPSSSRLGSLDYARANNNPEQGKETTTNERVMAYRKIVDIFTNNGSTLSSRGGWQYDKNIIHTTSRFLNKWPQTKCKVTYLFLIQFFMVLYAQKITLIRYPQFCFPWSSFFNYFRKRSFVHVK